MGLEVKVRVNGRAWMRLENEGCWPGVSRRGELLPGAFSWGAAQGFAQRPSRLQVGVFPNANP